MKTSWSRSIPPPKLSARPVRPLPAMLSAPPSPSFRSVTWNAATGLAMNDFRFSPASSTSGKANKSGPTDDARRDPLVQVHQPRQEEARSHPDPELCARLPRLGHDRTHHDDHS